MHPPRVAASKRSLAAAGARALPYGRQPLTMAAAAGAPRAKRRATRYGLCDAGAAADFDRLAAAAADAGWARRRVVEPAGGFTEASAAGSVQQVATGVRCEDDEALDATTDTTASAYHIEMLNDSRRNTAFATAVRRAVSAAKLATGAAPTVLEIGTGGAALLSLVAADAGAGRCIAVECDPVLAESARSVLAANKSTAVVATVHSTELHRKGSGEAETTGGAAPDDVTLPATGADVLLSELFDDRLLGEEVLPTIRHALASLAATRRLVVPARAAIYAVLVQSDTIARMSAGPSASTGMVNAPVNDPIEPMRVDGLRDLRMLSVPWEALTFNLSDLSQAPCSHRTVDVPLFESAAAAGEGGQASAVSGIRVDAIMFWWRATLWEGQSGADVAEDNSPQVLSSAEPNSHWMPCIYPLADAYAAIGPTKVARQQRTVRVTAWHDEQSVEFEVKGLDGACQSTSAARAANAGTSSGVAADLLNTDRAVVVSEDEDEVEESNMEQQQGDLTHANCDGDDAAPSATDAASTAPAESAESAAEGYSGDAVTSADPPTIDRMRRWMLADPARSHSISSSVVQIIRTAVSGSAGGIIAANHPESIRPAHVVCVGGGSGLCARAAMLSSDAQAGAISVTDVEWTAEHADAVRDAVSSLSISNGTDDNQPQCSVKVVDGAADLKGTLQRVLGTVAPAAGAKETVAAMVAEPYFVALSEGRTWAKGHALLWWWSVHTVRQIVGFFAPSARVWPALGRMRGMLVGFKRLWAATRPVSRPRAAAGDERTAGFDISEFGERGELARLCSHGRAAPIWQHEYTVCSQPFDLLEMDFSSEPPQTLSTPPEGAAVIATQTVAVASPGANCTAVPGVARSMIGGKARESVCSCNALVMWIDYAHADGGWPAELSTGPDMRSGGPTPWSQGIRFLEAPFDLPSVEQGQQQQIVARVHARLDTLGGGLKLDVAPTVATDATGCR